MLDTIHTTTDARIAQPPVRYCRATLNCGQDRYGNEINYWINPETGDWFDCYIEHDVTSAQAQEDFARNGVMVRFGKFELPADEWRELGCPPRLSEMEIEEITARKLAAAVDAWNQVGGAEIMCRWDAEAAAFLETELGTHTIISGGEVMEIGPNTDNPYEYEIL